MEKKTNIKQRSIARDIKAIDRAAFISDRMKKAAARTNDEAKSMAEGDVEHSPSAYAEREALDGSRGAYHAAVGAILCQRGNSATAKTLRTKGSLYARMKQMVFKRVSKKAAANSPKAAIAAFVRTVRSIISALRSLVMMISSGSAVIAIAIIMIIAISAILGSALGIFFSNEAGEGMAIDEAIATLSVEFGDRVEQIIADNPHDELEIVSTGNDAAIDWKAALAVYAVRTAEDPDIPGTVIALDEENLGRLRGVMNGMNVVSYTVRTEERMRTVTIAGPDTGDAFQTTDSVPVTILTITVAKRTAEWMAEEYGFTKSQKETLTEILSPEYDGLWEGLIGAGAYQSADGERRQPSADRQPKGMFSWPLEIPGIITSYFGWREDPITGKHTFHEGLDIAAPNSTPILAAADGIVTVANATDSYAGGWGYYVKINHGGGFETLYAHCSVISVRVDEVVTKGQIIGYIGSTGRSTGDHLHFEIYLDGSCVDPLSYFK